LTHLRNLCYTAQKDSDNLRKLILPSKSKKLPPFPYASASVLVTNQLLDLFAVRASSTCAHSFAHPYLTRSLTYGRRCNVTTAKPYFFPLLLSCTACDSVMGEFHSISIDLLTQHWKQGKCAGRDELSKIVPLLQMILAETLLYIQPESLSKLKLILDRQAKDVVAEAASNSPPSPSSSSSSSSKAVPVEKRKKALRSAAGRSLLRITSSRTGNKDSPRRDAKPAVKLFGGNLEEILKVDRLDDPSATVPRVITFLIEQLFQLDGTNLEGIFRISAAMDKLAAAKERLNAGDFDLEFQNAHYPAALIKQFYRELEVELIPSEF